LSEKETMNKTEAFNQSLFLWINAGVNTPLMATSKSPTCGQSNSPRQDG